MRTFLLGERQYIEKIGRLYVMRWVNAQPRNRSKAQVLILRLISIKGDSATLLVATNN